MGLLVFRQEDGGIKYGLTHKNIDFSDFGESTITCCYEASESPQLSRCKETGYFIARRVEAFCSTSAVELNPNGVISFDRPDQNREPSLQE
jgi:hypothetical protein